MASLVIRLPPTPPTWDGKAFATYHSPPAQFIEGPHIERVGRAYQQIITGLAQTPTSSSSSSNGASNGVDLDDIKYAHLKDLKSVDLHDFYGLLGLKEKGLNATDAEIRAQYKALSKVLHPDKFLPAERAQAEQRFKQMQEGYQVLIDPTRRRGYDSSLPFDDRIPSAKEGLTEKDFFRVYGPVFERNERFSVRKPCPKLGDMATPDDDVNEFYRFWTTFESWREFADLNEAKPENAGSREEKRKMERENKKKQEQRKKEEMKRVFQLADDALKKDPRIQRMKERADAGKKAKQAAKLQAAQQAEEEKKKKEEEEKARAEAEARAAEEARNAQKNAKQALKSARSYFAKYAKAAGFDEDLVQRLRESLTLEQFEPVNGLFKADAGSEKGKELVRKYAGGIGAGAGTAAATAGGDGEHKKEIKEEEKKAKEWTSDEVAALNKAVLRFPAGTSSRWEKITEAVNTASHSPSPSSFPHSMKEVIRKQKEIEMGLGHERIAGDAAFKKYLEGMSKGEAETERAKMRNMGGEEAENYMREREAERRKKEKEEQERQSLEAAQQRIEEQRIEREVKEGERAAAAQAKRKGSSGHSSPSLSAASPPSSSSSAADGAEHWSSEEQLALEKALKSVSKEAEDRWDQIAALVKTKSKKQCIARYKYIREEIIKQKK